MYNWDSLRTVFIRVLTRVLKSIIEEKQIYLIQIDRYNFEKTVRYLYSLRRM